MSNDALITGLSANLASVRRRSLPREAAWLIALGGAELALFLGLGLMRPDMGQMIGSGYMLWKLGSLALLALLGGAVAIRSFSPTASPHRGLTVMLALAGIAMIAGLFLGRDLGHHAALLDRMAPTNGPFCALAIVILSLPMVAMSAALMHQAAPSHPESSALAVGLAAGIWGAFVFAFCCPANDPLYVILWYSVGCAIVAALARWLLPKNYRL